MNKWMRMKENEWTTILLQATSTPSHFFFEPRFPCWTSSLLLHWSTSSLTCLSYPFLSFSILCHFAASSLARPWPNSCAQPFQCSIAKTCKKTLSCFACCSRPLICKVTICHNPPTLKKWCNMIHQRIGLRENWQETLILNGKSHGSL